MSIHAIHHMSCNMQTGGLTYMPRAKVQARLHKSRVLAELSLKQVKKKPEYEKLINPIWVVNTETFTKLPFLCDADHIITCLHERHAWLTDWQGKWHCLQKCSCIVISPYSTQNGVLAILSAKRLMAQKLVGVILHYQHVCWSFFSL